MDDEKVTEPESSKKKEPMAEPEEASHEVQKAEGSDESVEERKEEGESVEVEEKEEQEVIEEGEEEKEKEMGEERKGEGEEGDGEGNEKEKGGTEEGKEEEAHKKEEEKEEVESEQEEKEKEEEEEEKEEEGEEEEEEGEEEEEEGEGVEEEEEEEEGEEAVGEKVEEEEGNKQMDDGEKKAGEGGENREDEAAEKTPSVIETAAPTDAIKKEDDSPHHPLALTWCFGFNQTIPVHNVSNDSRKMVFYVSGHTGVLYDCESNRQCLLQGHGNPITCTAVSGDRRWLVTADEGDDPTLTVWDSFSGIPVRSLFDGLGPGCMAVAMSHDACFLATLSSGMPQVVSLWQWTVDLPNPIGQVVLSDHTHQSSLTFHPTDRSQLVSTGDSQVAFYHWDGQKLQTNSVQVSDKDFSKPVGVLSQSVFIPGTLKALTGTSTGWAVVWGPARKDMIPTLCSVAKKPVKLMKMHDNPITAVTTSGNLIVLGDSGGHIKFFSQELKLLHWYDGMAGSGPVMSISFGHTSPIKDLEITKEGEVKGQFYPAESTLEAAPLVIPNFTVSALTSSLAHITTNGTITDVLLRGHDAAIHAIAAHPSQPRVVLGGYSTRLQLWDYDKREVLAWRDFEEPNYIQCVSFDPQGEFIGLGFTGGVVVVLDSLTLQDASPIFHFSRDAVTHLTFSHDSQYMATADLDCCVTVYESRLLVAGEGEGGEGAGEDQGVGGHTWQFVAKYRSHYKRIEGILFGVALDSNAPRLLSVGQDRMLVEYDLTNTTTDNLCILSSDRIEQSALPTSLSWYPPLSKESFLLFSNSQYKLKLLNSTTKMCRKTILGPTYGSPLRKLLVLPSPVFHTEAGEEKRRYAAFITSDKVGLLLLPHDGNPHNSQCLLAHPTGVSDVVCSYDGRYVFTAGGEDCAVNMWSINTKALEAASHLGGEGLEPFYALLEGGRDGQFFAEMEEYFYYAQIRSQGPNTRDTRQVSTTVPNHQIPDLMRALGFYPSEQEIEDMLNEVKFSKYVETGEYVSEIDLGDFIRLYINHRPAFGLSPADLVKAFQALGGREQGQSWTVERGRLLALLQENGEHMTETELVEALMTLLGHSEDPETEGAFSKDPQQALEQGLPERVSAAQFAEQLLHLTVDSNPS